MKPAHAFRQVGNTEALHRYFRDRALAELRAGAGKPGTERHAPGLQCFIRYADRVEEVTPGRARTSTPAAKPKGTLSVGELSAQMEAVRTGIYNRTPAGRARQRIRDMERRMGELETERLVSEGRQVFADLMARNRRR